MNEYHPPLAIGKEELLWKWESESSSGIEKCVAVKTGRGRDPKLTCNGELLASSLGGLSSGGAVLFCFLREWKHTQVKSILFI